MKFSCKTPYDKQDDDDSFDCFVVVLTQQEDVANQLCRLNNWKKVVPMPGAYEPPAGNSDGREQKCPDLDWNHMLWSHQQLLQLVKSHGVNPTTVIRYLKEKLIALEDDPLDESGVCL